MLDVINKERILPRDSNKFPLCGIGDIHKGHKYHDEQPYKRNLKWLKDNKEWELVLMGDLIECASKHSKGLSDQIMTVDDQIDGIIEDFGEIADEGRIWGIIQGNHELRALENAGIDASYRIARELNIEYLGTGISIYLHVLNEDTHRGQNYNIYIQHGASAATTPAGKLNALMKMDNIVKECDLYMMGHLHTLEHHIESPFIIDRGNPRILDQHYVICGSYLTYYGSYAHRKGYPPSGTSGSAKIYFHTDKHKITVKL